MAGSSGVCRRIPDGGFSEVGPDDGNRAYRGGGENFLYNAVGNIFWSCVPMVTPYKFAIDQRVRILRRGGGTHRQPPESCRGLLGTIAPQMTDDWTGTKLELEPGTPNVYYVVLDSGTIELIAEDWLEPASASE